MLSTSTAWKKPDLVEIEDEVQLTDIAKIAVQHLHILMDHLESDQLVVGDVHSHHKVEAGIPFVDHLWDKQTIFLALPPAFVTVPTWREPAMLTLMSW